MWINYNYDYKSFEAKMVFGEFFFFHIINLIKLRFMQNAYTKNNEKIIITKLTSITKVVKIGLS